MDLSIKPESPALLQTCDHIRVLLVDDHDGFRNGLAEILRDDGHEVFAFASAPEALDAGLLDQVDLVLTDYEMPGGDGLALCETLHGVRPTLPILLLTSLDARRVALEATASAFVGIAQKPCDYDAIHTLLHQTVSRARS